MSEELWNIVDGMQRQRRAQHKPAAATREQLIEHIAQLQREMEEKIEAYSLQRYHRRVEAIERKAEERVNLPLRKVATLNEMVRKMRAKVGT